MAKNAGVDFDDWIADAVAEYAEDLGVDPGELSESERLEAIEERVDRLARNAPAQPPAQPASWRARDEEKRPARRLPASDRRSERSESRRAGGDSRFDRREDEPREPLIRERDRRPDERDRLAEAIDAIEQRAERSERRANRALESVTGLVEHRDGERERLEAAIRDIEKRAERNEERTARALESLSEMVETRGGERERLEDAVRQIEQRSARNEERTARALESLAGLVDARGGERDQWAAAVKRIEERAERDAERTARALESLTGLVETRRRQAAEAPPARPAPEVRAAPKPPTPAAVRPERAPAVSPNDPATRARAAAIDARFDDLVRRATTISNSREVGRPESPADDDSEALRLVAERLARRKKLRAPSADSDARPVSPPPRETARYPEVALAPVEAKLNEIAKALEAHDLGGTVRELQREMRTLAERIDSLSSATVGASTVESIRRQADDIERVLAAAADNAAPVERMERQIAEIGARLERLASATVSPSDIAAALKTLADAQTRIERAPSLAALAAIERRIDDLGGRIEEAARRPALDPRPLEDLARRVESTRAILEKQGAQRPDAAALAGKLQIINEKLDRASETGAQSAATVANLQEMTSRLEDALRRPAKVSLDARPIEELSRRVDKIRAAIESPARPDSAALAAKLQAIEEKLDRASETGAQSTATFAGLKEMTSRLEAAVNRPVALDQRPLEDLARRVETLRVALEQQGAARPDGAALAAKLQTVSEKLDRIAETGGQAAAMATLQETTSRLEEAIRRPIALDQRPLEDLARRVETLRNALEQQGASRPDGAALAAKLQTVSEKLDRIAESGGQAAAMATLQETTARLEEAIRRPIALDQRPLEDLARRVETLRNALEQHGASRPDGAALAAKLQTVSDKLDRIAETGGQAAAMASLQETTARLEEAMRRPIALDQRPLEDLSRRVETLRVALEQQGAARPDGAALAAKLQSVSEKLDLIAESGGPSAATMASLQEMTGRLEEAMRRPIGFDPRPLEDLSRRVESLRVALEQQGAARPDGAALAAKLHAVSEKLDRIADNGGPSAATMASLQEMTARLEAAMRRPAPAIDPRPIEDLARRIDGVRGAVARQDELAPKVEQLRAAVGEISQKLDRPPAPAGDIAGVEAALRKLSADVEAALGRGAVADERTAEELARRIETVRSAVERNGALAPQVERLDATLADLRARLDRPAENSQIEAVDATLRRLAAKFEEAVSRPTAPLDAKPIEDLARRIDSMKGVVERQESITPHVARLEAKLGEIREKLDRPDRSDFESVDAALRELAARVEDAVNRPTTVAIDPKPIEELARRIESVRTSLEASQVERLESALGAVAEKLDRAQPMIDANGLNSTLAEMNTRLEEAFRRPAQIEIDRGPIDALARRVEAVRESVERQSQQIDVVGRPIDDLARRLDAVKESVERQGERLDAGRIEELFRNAVAKFGAPGGPDNARLFSAIQGLAAKLESAAPTFNASRIEGLLARMLERLDRPGVEPAHFSRVVEALSALAARIDGGSANMDVSRIEEALVELADRVEEVRADRADVAGAIAELASKVEQGATGFDGARIEGLLEHMLGRIDEIAVNPVDPAALASAISELTGKIERGGPSGEANAFEDLLHSLYGRMEALDAKVADSVDVSRLSDASMAHLELAVRELAEKIGPNQNGDEARALAEDVRSLHDKIEDLALAKADGAVVEQAARAIADKIEARAGVVDPDALLGHVAEIHERLDDLYAGRPATAEFERAMRELTEELEGFRSAREAVGRGAATLADLRTDQVQFDRRMDARFSGLQDVLEKLVDRFARLEKGIAAEPSDGRRPVRPPAERFDEAPPSAVRSAIHDIPDRDPAMSRPPAMIADVGPLAAEIAAQGRGRETTDAAAKTAAISAHIAAARRAANVAAAEGDRKQTVEAPPPAAKSAGALGWAARAQGLVGRYPRPVLLGAAVLLALTTAVFELRGGHSPVRKSEIDAPTKPLALNAPSDTDQMPTGALPSTPNVIAAPLPAPSVSPMGAAATAKPAPALVAALPAGLPSELSAAGSNGDIGAAVEIAQRYLEGRTVPREPKTAAGWFQAAAEAGSPFAQYRLGALYEKGIGVDRDAAKAREWYKKAADAGNARAMHNLAVLFAQDGGSGKPDYAAALEWFNRAAALGVRDSQFNLGVLYGRGLGGPQDLASSWMWFSLAAKQGDADGAKKRDEVANRMDGRAMAKATKMLADFKAETPSPAANDPPPAPAEAATAPSDAKPEGKGGVKS